MKDSTVWLATAFAVLVGGCECAEQKSSDGSAACSSAGAPGLELNQLSQKEKAAGWKLLFNGQDLTGFQNPTREGKWEVQDGVLIGTGGAGVIAAEETFDNFVLTLEAKVEDTGDRRGNSGIFIRSTGLLALRGRWPDGPEIQIDHGDPNYWTGAIWKTAPAKKVTTRDGEWFGMKVEALGPRIRIWVNGELVTDHELEGEVQSGYIALQVHHPTDRVEFRNVKILPRKF